MSATQYWGIPETLTVSASPTPTATVFTVSNAGNLIEGQYILVKVGTAFERVQILDLSGNAVTLASALSAPPATPGEVRNGRVLIINSRLNESGVFHADAVSDLTTMNMTYAPAGIKYLIPDLGGNNVSGTYCWVPSSSAQADGEEVLTNPSGRWFRQGGGSESLIEEYFMDLFSLVTGDLPEAFNPRVQAIEALLASHTATLNNIWTAIGGTGRQTLTATASNNFGTISSNGAIETFNISVPGAAVGDEVGCSFMDAAQGIVLNAYVSAPDTVTIRATNTVSSATRDPGGSTTFRVTVRKY